MSGAGAIQIKKGELIDSLGLETVSESQELQSVTVTAQNAFVRLVYT